MTSIVTGEAVVLELRPASFAARGLGLLLDVVTSLLLFLGTVLLIFQLFRDLDPAAVSALFLGLTIFYLVILPVAVETLTRGKSLGKYAMGLRIVRDDGGSIRFRQALIRGVLGYLEIYLSLGSVAFLASMFNERSKRLGDLLAGTYSMRERVPATPVLRIDVPAQLVPWVRLADIARFRTVWPAGSRSSMTSPGKWLRRPGPDSPATWPTRLRLSSLRRRRPGPCLRTSWPRSARNGGIAISGG